MTGRRAGKRWFCSPVSPPTIGSLTSRWSASAPSTICFWDAPGHGLSRPFRLEFTLEDKADWLHAILTMEGVDKPILIGQSMGGYVSQAYLQRYPADAAGFVSIDSAPLKRKYVTGVEIWLLHRTAPIYRLYPHKALIKAGCEGCAETEYGRELMRTMWSEYTHEEFAALSGHGYHLLASAMEADLPYDIPCPALLICGERDKAGSTKHYNKVWSRDEQLPVFWVPDAGHNSNTDQPELINGFIDAFIEGMC